MIAVRHDGNTPKGGGESESSQAESVPADFALDELLNPGSTARFLLNNLFDAVYITDEERRILLWNRGAEEITGYAAEEVEGRHCCDNILNHVDEKGSVLCHTDCPLLKAIVTGVSQQALIYPMHRSGHRFPAETHVAPLRDRAGRIVAAIQVFRDVSREEEVRSLQEKFNKIMQQHVSQTAYDALLRQVSNGETAELKDLTVVHLDIEGFTRLSEHATPHEIVSRLNDIFGFCEAIIAKHRGDIDKFIGDALLAVFIDANDAIAAARQIQLDALPHYNALHVGDQFGPMQARIGVSSGMVLQGDVGGKVRKDLTVIGDVVNSAQRVQTVCPPGEVMITEAVLLRLSEANASLFEHQGHVALKGKSAALKLFRWSSSASGGYA